MDFTAAPYILLAETIQKTVANGYYAHIPGNIERPATDRQSFMCWAIKEAFAELSLYPPREYNCLSFIRNYLLANFEVVTACSALYEAGLSDSPYVFSEVTDRTKQALANFWVWFVFDLYRKAQKERR